MYIFLCKTAHFHMTRNCKKNNRFTSIEVAVHSSMSSNANSLLRCLIAPNNNNLMFDDSTPVQSLDDHLVKKSWCDVSFANSRKMWWGNRNEVLNNLRTRLFLGLVPMQSKCYKVSVGLISRMPRLGSLTKILCFLILR